MSNKTKLSKGELLTALRQFYGTENYYQTGHLTQATDGVFFLAEEAECHWLLAIVDSVYHKFTEDFVILNLTVYEDRSAKVVLDNGMDLTDPFEKKRYRCFHEQYIHYTDFVLDELKLYVQGNVILLPSEY